MDENSEALVEYNPEKFAVKCIFPSDNSFICVICNEQITQSETIHSHVWHPNHITQFQQISKSYTKVNDRIKCELCRDYTTIEWRDFLMHFHEKKHFEDLAARASPPKNPDFSYVILFDNQIIEKKPGLYNCCCCKTKTMTGKKQIIEHIVGKAHKKLQEIRIADLPTEQKSESDCQQFVTNSIYILTASTFYCYICNCSVSGSKNVSEHINGATHRNNLSKINTERTQCQSKKLPKNMSTESFAKFIFDNSITGSLSTNAYDCKLCSCIISGAVNVPHHVESQRHKQLKKKNSVAEKSAVKSKSSSNGVPIKNSLASLEKSKGLVQNCDSAKNTLSISKSPTNLSNSSKRIETMTFYPASEGSAKLKIAGNVNLENFNLRGIFLDGNSCLFLCLICNKLSLTLENIPMHVCGTKHCKNFEKMITSCTKINGQVICKLCTNHRTMSWKDFLIHFHDEKHFENLAVDKNSNSSNISYITLLNNQIIETQPGVYHCCSCTKEIVGRNLIDEHIAGKKHKAFQDIRNEHFPIENPKEPSCRRLVKNWFSSLTSTSFHCCLCNIPVQGLVACDAHISSIDHASKLMWNDDIGKQPVSQKVTLKQNQILSNGKLLKKMTKESFAELICDNSVTGPLKTGEYKCNLCLCMLSGRAPVLEHIESQRHNKLMNTNRIEKKSTNESESASSWESTENSSASWETYETSSQSYDPSVSSSGNWESSENSSNSWETVSTTSSYSASQRWNAQFEIPQNLMPLISKKLLVHRGNKMYCVLCSVPLPNQQTLFHHTNSKKHATKLGLYNAQKTQRDDNLPTTLQTSSVTNSPVHVINDKLSELSISKTEKSKDVKSTTPPQKLFELPKNLLQLVDKHSLQHLKHEVYCPSCDLHLKNVGALVSHTKSKRHISQLNSLRAQERRKDNELQKENVTNSPKISENSKKLTQDKSTKPPNKPIRNRNFDPKYLEDNMQHIYKFHQEKLRTIKLSCQLCIPMESNNLYCMTCEKSVSTNSLQTFYEHICCSSHITYLAEMERENHLFINYPNQFSSLTLAKEFMQETSEKTVQCHACNSFIEDDSTVILKHLRSDFHNAQKKPWKEEMEKIQQTILSQMESTWYNIQKYWCQPCDIEFRAEFLFAEHIESRKHKDRLRKMGSMENRLVYDACISCATLWIGLPAVYTDHCQQPLHKYLLQSGDYSRFTLLQQAKDLLKNADTEVNRLITLSNRVLTVKKQKAESLLKCLEDTVKPEFPDAKAHPFGSRVSGLGFPDSDIDVFLDCGTYNGDKNSESYQKQIIKSVASLLRANEASWEIDEVLELSRTPIIKLRHRATELSCDVSFKNGLSVENTKLIKCYIDNFPLCRKLMLFLKKWLSFCNLSGSQYITSYAICWYVIFYLQAKSILPSVGSLIAKKNVSNIIDNWETGICEKFDVDQQKLNFKKLLREFFIFYNDFDFRNSVACPLLGRAIPKKDFPELHMLPKEMAPYVNYIIKNDAHGPLDLFRIDSEMCIQDPYDLSHNLTKAVMKYTLLRFRRLSALSAGILNDSSK